VGLINLTEAEKRAAINSPEAEADREKYREHIRLKEEAYAKIEARDSVANLEHYKNITISKHVEDEEDEEDEDDEDDDPVPSARFNKPPTDQDEDRALREQAYREFPEFAEPIKRGRGRPPGSKTNPDKLDRPDRYVHTGAKKEDIFNMMLSINSALSDMNRRLEALESNQKKMAELQVKAVCDYVHGNQEQLIRRIKELISKPDKPSPELELIKDGIAKAFQDHGTRLDSFQDRIEDIFQGLGETKREVESLAKLYRAPQKTTPSIPPEKKPEQTNDLRSLCMRAFESIIRPVTPPDGDDFVRIERVFDLALQKANTNNQKATELFVAWLNSFQNHLIDNPETDRTVYQFFKYAQGL
jgi:hypothetical protein